MNIPTLFEVELDRAVKMVSKDKRQRWVYQESRGVVKITTEPVPYRDAVSVRWLPIPQCVAYAWRGAAIAHPGV